MELVFAPSVSPDLLTPSKSLPDAIWGFGHEAGRFAVQAEWRPVDLTANNARYFVGGAAAATAVATVAVVGGFYVYRKRGQIKAWVLAQKRAIEGHSAIDTPEQHPVEAAGSLPTDAAGDHDPARLTRVTGHGSAAA